MCVYIYIYIYIYKEKLKKQNNPKFDAFIIKVSIPCFGFNILLEDLKFMKTVVKVAMDI